MNFNKNFTQRELIEFFEGYYGGKYSGVFLGALSGYLAGFGGAFYTAAAKVIPKRYPKFNQNLPDIAAFEKNMAEILNEIPKPEQLPEPGKKTAGPEDWEKFLKEMRKICGGRTRLVKTLEGAAKRVLNEG